MMVKTNRSTFHTVYNIHVQQSAMQGNNDTTHRLSRRTAATTRFSPEGIGCHDILQHEAGAILHSKQRDGRG